MKCINCGFTWTKGKGNHDCQQVKDARYEALREAAQEAENQLRSFYTEYGTPEMLEIATALAKELKKSD